MAFGKRILLFLGLNLLIVLTISILTSVLGFRPYLNEYGIDVPQLAIFCIIYGFTGSTISLLLSRAVAKWAYGVQLIDPQRAPERERWLYSKVHELARRAGMDTMPEVGIYQSEEANAFATGPSKARALVAVSSGLFSLMTDDEIEGVLGHEISHVTNGDMVTMTLLQGVVNAFVMFISRLVAWAVSRDREGVAGTLAYYAVMIVLEIVLMILGSILVAMYSRHRECEADECGAKLAGREKMIRALEALQRTYDKVDSKQTAVASLKISTQPKGIYKLFSTHPPLEERIARLRQPKA